MVKEIVLLIKVVSRILVYYFHRVFFAVHHNRIPIEMIVELITDISCSADSFVVSLSYS